MRVPSISNQSHIMIMVRLNVYEIPYKGVYRLKTVASNESEWYGLTVMARRIMQPNNDGSYGFELNESGNLFIFLLDYLILDLDTSRIIS